MNKLLLTLTALSIAVVGSAQTGGFIGPKAINYGPNIKVPHSNGRHVGDPLRTFYTNYLRYTGPARFPSMDAGAPPVLSLHGPNPFQSGIPGYHPNDLLAAYKIPANSGQGTIAIVDAFHSNFTVSDFNKFCNQFGLPPETSTVETNLSNKVLSIVYAQGSKPQEDPDWAGEIALDTQAVHSIAPNTKIFLVLAEDNSTAALDQAIQIASNLPGVHQVSMSFSSDQEFAGENSEDSVFTTPGVTYFASTGDAPGVRGYPPMSPNVIAVGGTTIGISSTGTVFSDTAWSSAGAGISTFIARPSFQDPVQSVVGAFRAIPDMAAIADPETGLGIYETYMGGWGVVGGTSLACPTCASIANVRGQWKQSGPLEEVRQYGLIGNSKLVRDITQGSIAVIDPTTGKATGVVYTAGIGYDLTTGIGEPTGLYAAAYAANFPVISLANPFGTVQGGSVTSLGASDGVTYNIQSKLLAGTGQVASTEAYFKLSPPVGFSVSTAQLSLSALVNTAGVGGTNQVYMYNWATKVYDYVGAFPLFATAFNSTSSHSGSYTVNVAKYLKSDGTFHVLTRAILPQRLGTAPFLYKLDYGNVAVTGQANQ